MKNNNHALVQVAEDKGFPVDQLERNRALRPGQP